MRNFILDPKLLELDPDTELIILYSQPCLNVFGTGTIFRP